ncbi:MAG: CRISPR-associated protein Cst1 [Candidatus Promineifilaceae bacterium]
MLRYTGHPIVDVGVATILAFAGKNQPEEVTEVDLDAIAAYMAEQYIQNPLRGFLTVAFPNSGFTQPAFFKQPDKQQAYIERVLYAYRADTPHFDDPDIFMGLPVANVSFDVSDKLEPGRTYRQHIPLQTGEGVINFHPYGDAGLPVSGLTLFAIQAYPLGSAKCGGRTLFVHSDNPDIMVEFAAQFLEQNRLAIQTAQLESSKKMPEHPLKFRTLVIKTLTEALERRQESLEDEEPFSITVYHLSNSGQGADLDIYHLPSQLVDYLAEMQTATYRVAWQQIERLAWELFTPKRGQKDAPPDFQPSRNWLYEDLFNLAEDPYRNGRSFIRTYFLREAHRFARKDKTDPRGQYSTRREAHLISWKLTEPFLRRIMYMDNERIEQIRQLGDALADYIKEQNDKRFFRAFYVENRYDYLRNALIKANTAHVRRGHPPFLTLDNYISVFEEGEDLARKDWRLARDLVLIRMVEQLHKNGWLGAHEDAIPEADENES